MTNPKIEKVNKAIEKEKAAIAEHTATLRELERQRTVLEDAAIVALFRKEKLTDNDLSELLRLKSQNAAAPVTGGDAPAISAREEREVRV